MTSFIDSLRPEVYEAYLASECDRLTEEMETSYPKFHELIEKQIVGQPGKEGHEGAAAARSPLTKERVKQFGPWLGLPLQDTLERRLMALTAFHLMTVRRGELLFETRATLRGGDKDVKSGAALFRALKEKIPGIEIIEDKETIPEENCAWFIFQHEVWYQKLEKASEGDVGCVDRFLFSKDTLGNLEKVGYKKIYVPEKGAIIIYLNYSAPAHFGKVVDVRNDGQVIVESRFNFFYTCRHKHDSVPPSYGSQCVYMKRKETKSASLVLPDDAKTCL